MGTFTYTVPVANVDPNSVADPEIATALSTLLTWGNGNIDLSNLSASLQSQINSGTVGPRGAVNNVGPGSRTNTVYGALSDAPDQVTGLVLPTNGLLMIGCQATWQNSVGAAASAAIFLGANQLQAENNGTPQAQSISGPATPAQNVDFSTYAGGLVTSGGTGTRPTTGQVIGVGNGTSAFGPCWVFAAAGTYTVSLQYKATSGSVTASNRLLWAQVLAFS